ncbi:MAG: tetratricopeptide repeat protein, partial [Candidatus Electrothrix sp.]
MALSGYVNTFLLLTALALHPVVASAEQPDLPSPTPIIFSATPNNYSLLCNSQSLKITYINKLKSLGKPGDQREEADIYCRLGDLENVTRNFEKAKDAYREAGLRYKETDNLGLGRVWYGRGQMERKLNRYDDAEGAYEKANHYYGLASSCQGQAAVQLALGHVKRSTAKNFKDLKEVRRFYKKAKTLYQVEESRVGEANVLCALGDLECSLGNYEEARSSYEKAELLYKKMDNSLGLANVLTGQGDLERKLNKYEDAEKRYQEAEDKYEDFEDPLGLANVLTGQGSKERKLDDYRSAEKFYEKALNQYRQTNDRLGEANVLIEQGHLESRRDREKAQGLYNTAKEIYDQLEDKDKLGQANVALGLGRLKALQGELGSALTLYDKAEGLYRDIYNRPGLADALTGQGHLQGMQGKNDQARRAY